MSKCGVYGEVVEIFHASISSINATQKNGFDIICDALDGINRMQLQVYRQLEKLSKRKRICVERVSKSSITATCVDNTEQNNK